MRVAKLLGVVSLLWLPLAIGCSGEWSAADKESFLNDCLTNVRLKNEKLREAICACWLTRTMEQYSLAEVNGGDQAITRNFVQLGKTCSGEHGVKAFLPGEKPAEADEQAAAPPAP